jgi:hypothetical protein
MELLKEIPIASDINSNSEKIKKINLFTNISFSIKRSKFLFNSIHNFNEDFLSDDFYQSTQKIVHKSFSSKSTTHNKYTDPELEAAVN